MKKSFYKLLGIGLFALLVLGAALPVFADTGGTTGAKIHVDQVGYLPEYPKVAIVAAENTPNEFYVKNAETNETIYKGVLSAPRKDTSSGDTVRKADFSTVTTPGTYVVTVEEIGSSYTFKISDNVYYIPLIHTLRAYTLGRCNTVINDPVTGLAIGVAHEKYKTAKVYFSDDVSTKGEILDVSGGWYDAGDYGKYVPTGSITVANILLAYENQPEKFKKGQMFLPEGISAAERTAALPDVLVEMKYELDWMLKLQRPDGAVYLKTSGMYWPSLDVSPEQDTQNRYIFGLATYSTAMYGATNALAARIYKKYDSEYAAKLLDAAKKAFTYLRKHPEASFRMDEGQDRGSGPYDKATENEENLWLNAFKKANPSIKISNDAVDRIWLAAELFKTTGDNQYEEYLQQNFGMLLTKVPKSFSWMDTLALGQWAYITNGKADQAVKNQVKQAFLKYADNTLQQIAVDGYGCALKKNEYTWGSNKVAAAKANMLALAYQLEPRQEYLNGALDQVHYILGRNTNGTSYLTGSGTKPALRPHSRIQLSKNIYVPGLLVGGPNNWPGGDPLQAQCLANGNMPPAKVYFDAHESYSTNEYAIDYIAPVTFILAYFSKPNEQITQEDIKVSMQN